MPVLIAGKDEILKTLVFSEIIDAMRDALVAQARGEGVTPMPMHLNIAQADAEIHFKSGYRTGGPFFALKMAGTFPGNTSRGLPTGSGAIVLCSAETGEPVAFLDDGAQLTDVRTAAVSAMVARELGRDDTVLGILGSGVQARLQAQMHARVLNLRDIWLWGRTIAHAEACARDLQQMLPAIRVHLAASAVEVARESKFIITTTAARAPLLRCGDVRTGTFISAMGSDSPGKQELDPAILEGAALLLVDSRQQCARLGELQHATGQSQRAVEIGAFCVSQPRYDRNGVVVCDFTGLGIEDLYIAEYCYHKIERARRV